MTNSTSTYNPPLRGLAIGLALSAAMWLPIGAAIAEGLRLGHHLI